MARTADRGRAERGVDRFGLAALASAGALGAHQVGYLVGDGGSVSHGYLGVVGPLVVLTAAVAAWVAGVRILRHDPGRAPGLEVLAGAQVGAFLAMEVGERLGSGSLASLASTPVLVGLALQPLVAFVALRLLGVGRDLVASFRARRARRVVGRLGVVTTPVASLIPRVELARLRVRGPPV